jgi:glycosyltransferase involved in cell wall biosynthesis
MPSRGSFPVRQRKILILIHGLGGGGAERVTVNLAGIWASAGDDVVIATFEDMDEIAYVLPPGVRHVKLGIAGASGSATLALVGNIRRISRLRLLLREETPDIAIGMMTTSAVLLALARNNRMLAIGAEHNYPPLLPMGRAWEWLRRWSYGRLDAVTALTTEGRTWLLKNTRARHVVVAPNAIHMPLPGGDPVLDVSKTVPPCCRLMLSVGRLEPQKGFDRLIDAFAKVAGTRPDWILAILGEGSQREELEAQVDRLDLQERVVLPGWAGNLSAWYQASDFLALTSRFEGFGNVLIEAMAHNCPTLSVDCDTGPRDIIANDVNGLLVPQDDPAALTTAMARMMDETDLRARLATQAPLVQETFSPEKIDAVWQALFRLATQRTPRGHSYKDPSA